MLEIEVPEQEFYNEDSNSFITYPSRTLRLEHSLSSLSKWEMKWKKPFLSDRPEDKKTAEEMCDYICCMSLDPITIEDIYNLPKSIFEKINAYIEDPMTATKIYDNSKTNSSKTVDTAEVLYYYMVELGIPFECENWPLNKLIMLIKVCCTKKNEASGNNKMSKREIMERNRRLNEQRKAKMNTKG